MCRKKCLYSYEEVNKQSFFDVSDLFFECVSSEKRAKYFEDNFTEVKLLQQQIDFLTKVNWPYAYTLNVDDGIEQNSELPIGKNTTSERRITEACEYICKNCEQSGCERESRELLEYFERKEYIGEKYNVRNSRIHRR